MTIAEVKQGSTLFLRQTAVLHEQRGNSCQAHWAYSGGGASAIFRVEFAAGWNI